MIITSKLELFLNGSFSIKIISPLIISKILTINFRATPNKHSGDKTVPFESLSYPKHWKNIEDGPVIKTYEFKLSGSSVDHRSMVSEPVILELVVEIACGGKVVDKLLSTQRIVYEMEWIELSTNEKNVPVFLSTCFESLKLAGTYFYILYLL